MIKSIWPGLRRLAKRLEKSVFFITLASLFWLLWRSGTKPSRITYPCQKAAAFQVSSAVYLFPLLYFHRLRHLFARKLSFRQVCKYSLVTVVIFSVVALSSTVYDQWVFNQQWAEYRANAARGPVGKVITAASGAVVYATIPSAMAQPSPHRVVSVHNSNATTWIGSGHPMDFMDQSEINQMVERGVMSLTGKDTPEEAWLDIIPYTQGDTIAIKLNFNNLWRCSSLPGTGFTANPYMNPYPQLLNAVIDGLKSIGFSSENIWLTDPSRPVNDAFREGITDTNVQYYTKCFSRYIGDRPNVFRTLYVANGSEYSTPVDPSYGAPAGDQWINPARVFVNADHIINMPQLKAHSFMYVGGVTLGIKNHFGSVDFTEDASGTDTLHSMGSDYDYIEYFYKILVDINNNPTFRDKTRLILGDGLIGKPHSRIDAKLWESFGDNPSEILFFGVDPVAVDSVMFDYLQRESSARGEAPREDMTLTYAASIGLGIAEHWNNDDDREYTQIDYVEIDLDNEDCPLGQDSECDDSNSCTGDVCDAGTCRYINYNLDGSDTIGLGDIIQIIALWGQNEGEPGWNPDVDLDGNGNIGLADVIVLIGVWGTFC